MDKLTILMIFLVIVTGCSQKTTSIKKECQEIERKMLDLKQGKNLNLTAKIVNTVANGYPYGKSSKELEQRIKVLNMELESCHREQ